MSRVSELAVLHALRLGGVLDESALASRTGSEQDEVMAVLVGMERVSLTRTTSGQLNGWSLTAAGRRRTEELLADEVDRLGVRSEITVAYDAFRGLNADLLVLCTDWQVRCGSDPVELNDHADPDYDASVLARLASLHTDICGVLEILESAMPRFAGYRPRLSNALQAASEGRADWVTRPVIDSYHTVWFELHEDLLATLGRRRSDERTGGRSGGRRARSISAERRRGAEPTATAHRNRVGDDSS